MYRDIFDKSKPYKCPMGRSTPEYCSCPSCYQVLAMARAEASINAGFAMGTPRAKKEVMPTFTRQESLRDKIERQRRERFAEIEENWRYHQDNQDRYAAVAEAAINERALVLPVRIYETVNQMDDYQSKDMKRGDLNAQELRERFGIELETVSTKVNPVTLQLLNPPIAYALSPYAIPKAPKAMPLVTKDEAASLMFDEFRELAKVFSFQGPYKGVISELITHMQGNSGAPFSSAELDQALKEQILNDRSEQSSLLSIKKVISRYMNSEYSLYPLEYKNKFKDEIGHNSILPKFDRWIERTNGLVVSVHDTWATHITLESLEVTGNCYRARVHYRIQDHFGLDNADVLHPIYRQARIFRLWFALQRWELYGYKPFITEMNATVEISGVRGE